jgi:hypothetical protein
MNGPNEKAKNTRSPGPTPAPVYTCAQHRAHQDHDASVSSQRIGALPVVPLV